MAPPPLPPVPRKRLGPLTICILGILGLVAIAAGTLVVVRIYRIFNPPQERTDYR